MLLLLGCATSPFDRKRLSADLSQRTGHALSPPRSPGDPASKDPWTRLPPGVNLKDGLSEEESVATALWNNPAFIADLATLDLSRADLVTAGMIRNPLFTLLLPLGPKQLEFTGTIPVEELWQRPRRVAAAKVEVERVAHNLVQTGLDLVRDTKLAFTELLLAQNRERISQKNLQVRQEIARIAESRLRAGDISELEAQATRLDALSAEVDQVQGARAVTAARENLWLRLGLGQQHLNVALVAEPSVPLRSVDLDTALKEAVALRPDVRAAELAMEVAADRLGWERARIFNALSALVDANGKGRQGFEMGPGLLLELPLFNQNQGGRARAHAEIERAAWRYVAVRQQVEAEVRAAVMDATAAQTALQLLHTQVLAAAERNVERARRAFSAGDVPYLSILDSARQQLDVQLREAALEATLRRSAAQLDRSTGRKHAKR